MISSTNKPEQETSLFCAGQAKSFVENPPRKRRVFCAFCPQPLFAHGDHLKIGGLQDILIFFLRHGSGDGDLMVIGMSV